MRVCVSHHVVVHPEELGHLPGCPLVAESAYQEVITTAEAAGEVIGERAGSWFIDGNTSTERCEAILRQIEECDFDGPSFREQCYLDQATEEFDLDGDIEWWHDAFALAAADAAEAAIVRAARAQLGPDCDPYYQHPED